MEDLFPRPSLDELVSDSVRILEQAKTAFNPVKTFALCSGGNDSITALYLSREQIDAVVHISTGIGILETTDFVQRVCGDWGLELIILVTPPVIYRDIVLGVASKGFPGPALHYVAYHRLKAQRLQELQRDHSKRGEKLLLLSGVRSKESKRRKMHIAGKEFEPPRGRLTRCCWANPIVHFDSTAMLAARENFCLPVNPVWELLHKSGECLCGCFADDEEMRALEMFFPETARYIHGLEDQASAAGKRYCKWGAGRQERDGRPLSGPACEDCLLLNL